MDITKIAFVNKVGIGSDNGRLLLNMSEEKMNHVGTIHAGALYTLAETASGQVLYEQFTELADSVIPLLRESQIKYKKSAESSVWAKGIIDNPEAFKERLISKGCAFADVMVEVRDVEDSLICSGIFNWYVQINTKKSES